MKEKEYKAQPIKRDYETRWFIVSTKTGEVLDDAQGYGYKTAKKAYAGYGYKTKSPAQKAAARSAKKVVQSWCKKNPDVARDVNYPV